MRIKVRANFSLIIPLITPLTFLFNGQIPKTQNLPRLNHEEIENLNRLITRKETEFVTINLLKRSPGPDDFIGKFYKTLKEELTLIFLKLFQKPEKEETLSNSFVDSIILISKLDKSL